MKTIWLAVALVVLFGGVANAAPVSDGSIYQEDFDSPPNHPLTNTVGAGAAIYGGAGHIDTVAGTEGVVRQNNTVYPGEYVIEYDWTLHAPSGDNFYMLYTQTDTAPYFTAVALRTYPIDATSWGFQVDHGEAPFYALSSPMSYNQTYHVTLHVKPGPAKPVDVYVDGLLMGEFDSRNPSLTTELVQFGDPSSAAGFGSATVDNVSIGAPVVIPEPSAVALAASAFAGCVAVGRRRLRNNHERV